MKFTTHYLGVKKVVYEFDESDVEKALKMYLDSITSKHNYNLGKWQFEWEDRGDIDNYESAIVFVLTHHYETESTEGESGEVPE